MERKKKVNLEKNILRVEIEEKRKHREKKTERQREGGERGKGDA